MGRSLLVFDPVGQLAEVLSVKAVHMGLEHLLFAEIVPFAVGLESRGKGLPSETAAQLLGHVQHFGDGGRQFIARKLHDSFLTYVNFYFE